MTDQVACENIRFSSVALRRWGRNVPSGEERVETDAFAGYRLGDFTYFTPNGVSSIDYAVVSEKLLTEIMGFVVSPLTDWSCHCLISFVLKSEVRVKPKKSPSQLHPLPVSFKWNNILKTRFLDELSSQQVVDRLNKFSNACLKDVSYDVDDTIKRSFGCSFQCL